MTGGIEYFKEDTLCAIVHKVENLQFPISVKHGLRLTWKSLFLYNKGTVSQDFWNMILSHLGPYSVGWSIFEYNFGLVEISACGVLATAESSRSGDIDTAE